jgi:hypothetical protein
MPAVMWRRGFLRLWLLFALSWVGLVSSMERPDVELMRDRSQIVIQYGDITTFKFPNNTNEEDITQAINKWIQSVNVD